MWRLAAEHAYSTSRDRAEERRDYNGLEVLRGLREELDELDEFKRRKIAAFMAEMVVGEEEDDDDDDDKENVVPRRKSSRASGRKVDYKWDIYPGLD